MERHARARRAYRRLLRLLPLELRHRYGPDMEELFLRRLSEAPSRAARAWVWVRAILDVTAQAVPRPARAPATGASRTSAPDRLRHDLRYAVRSLRSAPVLTVAAIVTLALGIGASTATFSVVHAVFLRPLPFSEPERLVVVWPEVNANRAMTRLAAEHMASLESVTGVSPWTLTLTGAGDPSEITGTRVSPQHFDVLGVRPLLGRAFTPEEATPGASGVVILTHDFWVRAFGADPDVIGRTVDIGGADHERRQVVGVMPEGVGGLTRPTDVWIPLDADPTLGLEEDESWYVNVRVGRLAPGATLTSAGADVLDYAAAVQRRLPRNFTEQDAGEATIRPLRAYTAGDLGPALWAALGAVTLVLLIACANVAGLLLARGEGRAHGVGVRSALGASRGRVMTMHLAEAGVLAGVGGALGVACSYGLVRVLVAQAPRDFPAIDAIAVNPAVLLYALVATAATAALAGSAPALRAGRVDPVVSLGGGVRGAAARAGGRLSPILIGAQIALAVVVAVGSGLMLRSLTGLLAVDTGIDASQVLTLRPTPPASRYPDGTSFAAYYGAVTERLRELPGVEAVGAIHILPGTANNWSFPAYPEGVDFADGAAVPTANFRAVRGDYFRALRIRLRSGRLLADTDRGDTEPVAVVNEAFVARYWPGEDPLGRSFSLFSPAGAGYRVVGVVADVRQHARRLEPRPEMYFAHEQVPYDQMAFSMVLRFSGGDPTDRAAEVQRAVWSVDPGVPISAISDMASVLGESTRATRLFTLMLSAFGAFALVLGAVGVFGVTSYGARGRHAEFGVRLALGASPTGVLAVAARRSLVAAALGMTVGLLGAAWASGALRSTLYGVAPGDPLTFVAVAVLLGFVVTLAAVVPAWRACRVDLVRVLGGD